MACVGEEPSELGFDATSSDFLKTFLEAFPINDTWDVIPCDALKSKKESLTPGQDFAFIINLDRSHEEGSHFVVLYKKGENLFYLDPLKLNCFRWPDIPEFIRAFDDLKCWQLSKPVQSRKSWYCGFFALNYIYSINEETSQIDFVPLSTYALRLNNCRVLNNLGRVMEFYWKKKKNAGERRKAKED